MEPVTWVFAVIAAITVFVIAAVVVAGVGLLVTFFNGRADRRHAGRSEPGSEALE